MNPSTSPATPPNAHGQADRGATYRSVWRHLVDTDFRQGHVVVDGLRTRYVEAGPVDAPVVVMLHGTGGHWETFCANIPEFAPHFRCYALDMIGCGFTDKPDRPYEISDYVDHVLGFMDVMGIESASFVGVSLGSWVACRLALTAPERARRLVLNAPTGLLQLPADARATAGSDRSRASSDPTWENAQTVLGHLFYDRSSMIDDIVAVRQLVSSQTPPTTPGGAPRTLTLLDPEVRARNLITEKEWADIKVPALVIAHVDAPDVFLTTGLRIAELMPDTTVAEIHEASHWPHFEQPEAFNAVALPFLQGDESR